MIALAAALLQVAKAIGRLVAAIDRLNDTLDDRRAASWTVGQPRPEK